MKSYLLNIADSAWLDLINKWRDLNDLRKKRKLSFVHKSTLFRFALEELLKKTPAELSDLLEQNKIGPS